MEYQTTKKQRAVIAGDVAALVDVLASLGGRDMRLLRKRIRSGDMARLHEQVRRLFRTVT
ncbi:MAG: hypothetical protein CVV05_15555 [Gammaproteobacteria bacterium HGW-Gammaproteobacteria-1]|jgi:hypothetical protein|nr:MAG: hypothetical protein CVV05_15555 [Gammaproteobacteria bacterium HGW-Gammaproteobacteria-1]